MSDPAPPRGVLRTPADGAFALHRFAPIPALAPYVTWAWVVEWDRRGLAPHTQATLAHPSAHLVVEQDGEAWLYGPARARFEAVLREAGRTVALRFRAGGARALVARPMAALADRRVPAAAALPGLDVRAVRAERGAEMAAGALQAAVAPLLPAVPDPRIAEAERALALLEADRSLVRVAQLAERLGTSPRSLQRLFADHVGVGVAWAVRRQRVQDAAAAALAGSPVDWARLAAELGYVDQAHLVREFTAAVGVPPARYAAAGTA